MLFYTAYLNQFYTLDQFASHYKEELNIKIRNIDTPKMAYNILNNNGT